MAESRILIPVSNLSWRDDTGLPETDKEFQVMRLNARIAGLSADKKNLVDKLTMTIFALQKELRMWQVGLIESEWPTIGQVHDRIRELKVIINQATGDVGKHYMLDELKLKER